MRIITEGQDLEDWLWATDHTCHRCKTVFRPERGDTYELIPSTLSLGSVRLACPKCGIALCLYPEGEAPASVPVPYPVPYPVPQPLTPWYPSPGVIYGDVTRSAPGDKVTIWNGMLSDGSHPVNAGCCPTVSSGPDQSAVWTAKTGTWRVS